MKTRYEIVLAGSGGQGLVVGGKLLGEAAILDGKVVVQTQTYGIAQRGGQSAAEVIIDTAEIVYQQVRQPDIVIALSDAAIRGYADQSLGFPLIYDSGVVKLNAAKDVYGLPLAEIAAEIGSSKIANLVAIGAMAELVPVVTTDSLIRAIRANFPPAAAERNIQAVFKGMQAIKQYAGKE